MQIQKIKATAYAISKRIKGEQLLRNPNGVPATTVSTMRFVERIDPVTLDKSSSIIIKTRDFLKQKAETIKSLYIDNYAIYHVPKKGKKWLEYSPNHTTYFKTENGITVASAERGCPNYEELDKRDFKLLEKVASRIKAESPLFGSPFQSSSEYTIERTFRDVQLDKYYEKNYCKKKPQYNFFKTLWQNLNNK